MNLNLFAGFPRKTKTNAHAAAGKQPLLKRPRFSRRFPVFLAVFLLCLSLVTFSVYAWMKNGDERENPLTVADLKGTAGVSSSVDASTYTVKNESDQQAVVRVMVLPVATLDDGTDVTLLDASAHVSFTLASDWQDGGDGWYYYTKLLDPGGTRTIFSGVNYPVSGAIREISVKAEFVAAASDGSFYAYRSAWFGGGAPGSAPLSGIDTALKAAIDASY
jgi:hypothetical protein